MKVIYTVDAVRQPMTGVGRYTLELARALARQSGVSLTFMQGSRHLDALPVPAAGHPFVPVLRNALSGFSLPTAVYRHQLGLRRARALRGHAEAIFHGTNYYLPVFPGRSIVTIHDVSAFTAPEYHRPDRVRYMHKEVALAVRRAARILTVSEFSKAEITRVLGVDPDRIRVTPLGIGPEFHPHEPAALKAALSGLPVQPGGYCLSVGTVEPRKNLTVLLDAFASLPAQQRQRCPLVLAGDRGWESADLHRQISRAVRDGWLIYLGYVPDRQLPALMAGARLFVYPSLYEGFGLPPLEAMASGVPVVCSDAPALAEAGGDAARMVSPHDPRSLAEAIAQGLDDETWREQARARGLNRAARFSWERCAQLTGAAYRELAA
ncbi:glycosyltransferase family 4 protein [Bradyrhizobium sp. HKCCYLS20291]|uniref:glycosyltransferase family 4 protein n=1 Tax=Bradyrhizobium sp. HKCCYLS20291 TaxID=3420766 RepID=UPI003EBA9DBF